MSRWKNEDENEIINEKKIHIVLLEGRRQTFSAYIADFNVNEAEYDQCL